MQLLLPQPTPWITFCRCGTLLIAQQSRDSETAGVLAFRYARNRFGRLYAGLVTLAKIIDSMHPDWQDGAMHRFSGNCAARDIHHAFES